MSRRLCVGLCAVGMVAGATFVSAPSVSAATLTVTTVNDSGAGSFRDAVAASASGDVIVFDPAVNGQTITLLSQLTIDKDITINGNGPSNTLITPHVDNLIVLDSNVTIRGIRLSGGGDEGLMIRAFGANTTALIENSLITQNGQEGIDLEVDGYDLDVTVRNSTVSANARKGIELGDNSDRLPGQISLLVENSTISNNGSDGIDGNSGAGTQVLTVVSSTFSNNGDDGIDSDAGATLLVINSTFSGNADDGLDIASNSTVVNSTIVNNGSYGIDGPATATITNTIVYGNTLGDCVRSVVSGGGNIAGDATCGLTGTGDRSNTNPLLGALAANGGPTRTHLPQTGSPAIDAGLAGPCPATDQRGQARPQDGNGDGTAICDVGAVEVAALPVVTTTTAPPTTAPPTTAPATTASPTTAPAPTAPDTDAPTTIAGLLPSTGVDASGTQIWIGLMLMALGAALVMGVRRRHTVG
jgi:large repetitive protein